MTADRVSNFGSIYLGELGFLVTSERVGALMEIRSNDRSGGEGVRSRGVGDNSRYRCVPRRASDSVRGFL